MRSMTEGVFLGEGNRQWAMGEKQDPLRLTSFDTSPGGPGEATGGTFEWAL